MAQPAGKVFSIGAAQRQRHDWIAFSERAAVHTVQRDLRIARTAHTRSTAAPRPCWLAVFTKAYAQAALSWPQLRRAYLTIPWQRIYEHPQSVASVAIARNDTGEETVFQLPIPRPESLSLVDLDLLLRRASDQTIEAIPSFRNAFLSSRWPRWFRWSAWHFTLAALGSRRSRVLGTFAVAACSHKGAELVLPRSPLTSTLTYGVVNPRGEVDVRISYDPRVLTGSLMASVLTDLERILNEEIVAELRYLEGLAEAV